MKAGDIGIPSVTLQLGQLGNARFGASWCDYAMTAFSLFPPVIMCQPQIQSARMNGQDPYA